jgi:phytoene synthase
VALGDVGAQVSRDTSFYYSFLMLPPRKRGAIVAVWDFCRAVDDAVDEVVPEAEWQGGLTPEAVARAQASLGMWRSEVQAMFAGGEPSTEQARALKPVAREFGLPREPFETLIDGVEMDLEHARYATFADLTTYCRKVASTVGLICVEIFGYRDPGTRDYAVSLGMALQLTNIIRDVATDLRRGRVYLPAEDLSRFGVSVEDLQSGAVTPPVRALLRYQCGRAREFYRRAASELPAVDARSLVAAEIMGGIYFAILERIERADYDVFSSRIRVPRPQRALLALGIWGRTLLGAPAPRRVSTKA